jgi:hypothetical protein
MTVDPRCQLGHGHTLGDAVDEEFKGFSVGRLQRKAVKLEEDLATDPGNTLISVNEWLIFRERLHEGSRLEAERRIGVLAKYGLLRPTNGRSEAIRTAPNGWSNDLGVEPDDIFDGEELQLRVGKCLEQRSILFHDPPNHRHHIVLGDGMALGILTDGVGNDVIHRPALKGSAEL